MSAVKEVDVNSQQLQFAAIEMKLQEWGLPYVVETEFPLAKITTGQGSQVRELSHIAPKERVEEYSMQMKNGAMFPPLILSMTNHAIIDGNTRLAAAKRVQRKTFPVILVDAKTEDMAVILAAAVNQMGGERLTSSEACNAALRMMTGGYPDHAIGRELGRDLSQIRRWRAQKDATERATGLGLNLENVPRTSVEKLAEIRLEKPFVEMAKLLVDTRLGAKDTKAIVEEVAKASSESAAVKVVEDKREELAPCGPPPHAAARSRIPLARAACGTIIKAGDEPSAVFNPKTKDEELDRWTKVGAAAAKVIAAIQAV